MASPQDRKGKEDDDIHHNIITEILKICTDGCTEQNIMEQTQLSHDQLKILNGIVLFWLLEMLFAFLKSSSIILFISFFASSSSSIIVVWFNSSGKMFSNLVYLDVTLWIVDFIESYL